MKIKALVSFSGLISMGIGEERDITDNEVLNDLLSANYVEEVRPTIKSETKPVTKKGVKKDENK